VKFLDIYKEESHMKYTRMHWDRRSPASNPHEKCLTVRNVSPLEKH